MQLKIYFLNPQKINDSEFLFDIYENNFWGNKIFKESSKASIICTHANLDSLTSHPIYYNFNIIPDTPPLLSIIEPEYEFELDETNTINLKIQLDDELIIAAKNIDIYI